MLCLGSKPQLSGCTQAASPGGDAQTSGVPSTASQRCLSSQSQALAVSFQLSSSALDFQSLQNIVSELIDSLEGKGALTLRSVPPRTQEWQSSLGQERKGGTWVTSSASLFAASSHWLHCSSPGWPAAPGSGTDAPDVCVTCLKVQGRGYYCRGQS